MENGNRLVKMLLEKKSIPYSLRIGGEWCRVIHNNQQPVCSECHEPGHTRKRCPEVICRICKESGHMSYNCDQRNNRAEEQREPAVNQDTAPTNSTPVNNTPVPVTPEISTPVNGMENVDINTVPENNVHENGESSNGNEKDKLIASNIDSGESSEAMETEHDVQGCKRHLSTDSYSDSKTPSRRQRINPAPSLNCAKQRDKSTPKKT